MYFPQTLREHKGKTGIAKRTSSQVDKSKSVRPLGLRIMLGKPDGPEDAIRRWSDHQVSTLKMYPTFRELQGLDGDPIDFEWKIVPRSQSIGYSPEKIKQTYKESTSHLKNSVIE